jgi:hypothetical protein
MSRYVSVNISLRESYDLWKDAWAMAGMELFYLDFLHPNEDYGKQRFEIHRMCKDLAEMRVLCIKDSMASRTMVEDWMDKFEELTENLC